MSNDSTSPVDPSVSHDGSRFSAGMQPAASKRSNRDTNQKIERGETARVNANLTGDELDIQLVDQAKTQIRTLVQEIAELSKTETSDADFYEGFLTRTVQALASVGGAIWVRDSVHEPLKLQYHINLKQTSLADDSDAQAKHSQLLNKLVEQGEPVLIGPQSENEDGSGAGNPTDNLLVVGPLTINRETIGLVEIFQRAGAGPSTQGGYLRFVTQMCDLASDFLSNQRIRSFAQQQAMWQILEQFIRAVHSGLDTRQTVYTIANEGRRLLDVDRVSVGLNQGRRCRIEAVSGLDTIERRADQVKQLGKLAATVVRSGEPLWYDGDDTDLPPQIETRLQDYVDKSHTRMLAIIPLKAQLPVDNEEQENKRPTTKRKPLGVLIVEQLKDARISPALQQRTEVLVTHSETALTNSLDHNSIFLMPLWKFLGKIVSQFRGGKLVRTSLILGCLFGVGAFLTLFPYSFGLGAKGELIPETQHEVFAQVDGVLQEVLVSDTGDTSVQRGQLLARMTNNDLMVEIENLEGQIEEARQKLRTNQILQSKKLDPVDRQMIAGEIRSLNQTIHSLGNELQLKQEEAELLNVISPASGQVVNWQVRQNLLRRPVLRGQNLMTIVDPATTYQIELEMPERRLAHLIEAMRNTEHPLKVTFGLVSHPGTEYVGRVLRMDRQLNVHSDNGNTALLRIGFDNSDVDPELLRTGTRVTAQVHCGTRSIGYVMFHELIETVHSSVIFWF